MAVATHRIKDGFGVVTEVGQNIPEYGSLRCVSNKSGVLEIEGLSADASKLPTNCKQGSQAFFLDTKKVKKFNESDSAWKDVN